MTDTTEQTMMSRDELNELRINAARDTVRRHYTLNATDGARVFAQALRAQDIMDALEAIVEFDEAPLEEKRPDVHSLLLNRARHVLGKPPKGGWL